MNNTFDKLKISELIELYDMLVVKLNDYKPDTPEYTIIETKLHNIEAIIQQKKPSYFTQKEQKEDKAFIDNVLSDNYEIQYVAQMFNVSRQTLYNWIKKGKINVIKIGRKPYIPKTEIEKIVKHGIE
jgi:excisionase family DNA binding protein